MATNPTYNAYTGYTLLDQAPTTTAAPVAGNNSYYVGAGPTYQATQMAQGSGPYGAAAGYSSWLDSQIQAQRDAGRTGTSSQGFQYSDYSPSEQAQLQRDYQTYVSQTGASNQINKAFDAFSQPGGYYSQIYQNTLNPAMAQIQRQYGDAVRGQTFNAADRGLIGGSQDVFQKSRLGDAATLATQNAQLGAQQAQASAQSQYEGVRSQLLQQLYNPTQAGQSSNQAYQSAIQTLLSGQGQLNQSMLSQLGITANANQQSSQNMGNLFGTAAGIVNASPYTNLSGSNYSSGMASAFNNMANQGYSTGSPGNGWST